MADGASIGSVYVDVEPRAVDFWNKVIAQTRPGAVGAGDTLGATVGKGISDKVRDSVGDGVEQGTRKAAPKATKSGTETGEAFGRGLKARLTEILRDLPKIKVDGDTSDVDRKLAAVRQKIADLKGAKLGVDLDEAGLRAKVDDIKADLAELEDEHPSIEVQAVVARAIDSLDRVKLKAIEVADTRPVVEVQADTAAADEKLAATAAEADGLAAKSPSVTVDADTARAEEQLAATGAEAEAVGAESPTIHVDVDGAGASAGLGAIGAEAEGASGSLFSLVNIGIALGPALIPAAAGAAAALGALGAVAFAVGGAITVVALALAPVIAAVKAMGAAQTAAGNAASGAAGKQLQMAGAIDQVRSAQASLANTVANAADSQRRAGEAVTNAVLAETDANRQLYTAQQAVTQARIDAARAAEDLNSQIAHNALDQRQAALDLQKAQAALAAAKAGGGKSNAPVSGTAAPANSQAVVEAQLQVDEALQRQKDLAVSQTRLAQDKQKSDRAGIDGSTQVVAAIDKVRAATEAVHKAEQATADARLAYAAQERQNEYSIEQAKQGVVSAQRAVQQASVSAGTAGAAATNKLADAMAALSPAGQAFARFLFGLKPLLVDLSKAAQDGFLPGLQAGMQALLPVMPAFTEFVRRLSGVLGGLAQQALTALASPYWQSWFQSMSDIAIPLLQQMGPLFLDVAKGFSGLFLAFAPFAPQIIGWLSGLAAKFADWATTLNTNSGFQAFINYVNTNGPLLVSLLGSLLVVAGKLIIALAPLGALILQGLTALVEFLAKLSPGQLIAIAAAIGLIVAAIVLLVGGPVTAVVVAATAIAAALVYAYTHVAAFRDIVNAAWNQVIKPAFLDWLAYEQMLIAAAITLFDTSVTAYRNIAAAVAVAYTIIRPLLDAIGYVTTQILAPAFLFLWRNAIEPAWQGIQIIIGVAWAAIQVIFGLIQISLKILGAEFRGLYDFFIRPVWEGAILPLLRVVGNFIHDSVVPAWQSGVAVLGQVFDGIRDKVKAPIRFVIQTVLNDGLLGAYNWVASRFGVKPDNVHVALPAGFASGGLIEGPGGPRDDAILARLSAGEFVVPAHVVSAMGVDWFNELIGRGGKVPRYPGDGSQGLALPGFADGGLVGALKSVWNAVSDPVGWVKDKVSGIIGQIPGAGILTGVVAGVGHKLVDGALGFIRGLITDRASADGNYQGPISAQVADVQNWIRQQNGKPYIWAGAGPQGYDCSGFVGSVILALQGKSPYHRIFSTSNEASYIRKPAWTSPLTVGWAGPGERGGGRVGHTTGNLAGLPFEAGGALGNTHYGPGSTSVTSFAHIGSYDTGGPLPPGLTIARNDTGKTEWVLTNEQMAGIAAGHSGSTITIPVTAGPGMNVTELAHAVAGELAWQMR